MVRPAAVVQICPPNHQSAPLKLIEGKAADQRPYIRGWPGPTGGVHDSPPTLLLAAGAAKCNVAARTRSRIAMALAHEIHFAIHPAPGYGHYEAWTKTKDATLKKVHS